LSSLRVIQSATWLTLNSDEKRRKRSSSHQSECRHRHVRVLSAWLVYESLASLWMTGWRPPTTWPYATVVVLQSAVCDESCARAAFRRHRCTTIIRATVVSRIQYAAPAWSGMCSSGDRGRLDSILRHSNNDLPSIVELFNWRWFLQPHQDKLHAVTYYSHICLTNSIYLTNFEPAPTTNLLPIKQNCLIVQISSYLCCINTPIST